MVNPFKGEVLVEDGEGKKYKFALGMFAHVVLEEATGEPWATFWQRFGKWSDTDGFNLFSAGLAMYHEDMGKRDIASLMDRLGARRCGEIINEAIEKASPPSEQNGAKPAKEDAKGTDYPTTLKRKQRTTAQPSTM